MIRSILAARRVLIVAPHPDDETIGAWGLMRLLCRRGATVRVLVVSDGAASHPESRRWPVSRLVRERHRETLRAMRALAIPPSRVGFLMLPDGALDAGAVAAKIARRLRRLPPPDLIVGPVPDDAHPDHRAVAHALSALPRRGERRCGYRVWPAAAPRGARGVRVALGSTAMAEKRRAVRSYRTQAGLITDAVRGFAISPRQLDAFVRPCERFEVLA